MNSKEFEDYDDKYDKYDTVLVKKSKSKSKSTGVKYTSKHIRIQQAKKVKK
jgi:hypothetical protein